MMFYKEVNFKETSIGRIPEDWEVIRFQEVADIRSNRSKLEVTDKVAFIPMELIPDDDIYADFEIRDFNKVSSYTYCEAGDILLAKITPSLENGKQGIVPSNIPKGFALATTEVFPIVCRNVERMFLFYLLKYPKFRKILESSMRATTGRLRVPKEALLNLKIPLPKFDEQQKIAEILSTVDEAVQKINEIIAKTERLKRGLMQELLTRGLTLGFIFDTNIFDEILDRKVELPKNLRYHVTHIQLDELLNMPEYKRERKEELLKLFSKVPKEVIVTEGAVLGVSRLGLSKLMSMEDAELYDKMLEKLKELDEKSGKKKTPENQARDILIALTCMKNCLTLVTNDDNLKKIAQEFQCSSITFKQLLEGEYRESKDTEIGRIPKEWKVNEIGELFEVVTGTTPSTKDADYWNGGNINWFTPLDLSRLDGRILISESERKITPKALKEYNLTLMPPGSIILSTRAPVGYVAVLDHEGTFNQGCKGLIPKDKKNIHPLFYSYYLLFQKQKLECLSSGSTFKELSKTMLENFKIPLPSLQEQQRIAEILSNVDRKLEIERKEKARLERIKQGLMDLLLTGKIRVKVVNNV